MRLQPPFVEELGREAADRRMKPPRLLEEQPAVGGDGLMAVQQVMKGRDIRAFGMAALHGLVELLRIAEQHDGPGSLGDGQDIRQRHLRGLVDEQHIDRRRGIGPRPEPGRGRGDMARRADCRQQSRIVLREAQPRLIRFGFARPSACSGHRRPFPRPLRPPRRANCGSPCGCWR